MKKRVGIILSVILASTMAMTPVYATENIDLDSMSVEELITLRDSINEKLKEKVDDSSEGEIIPQGVYKVGTDIKAGQFSFSAYDGSPSIEIFESEETYTENHNLEWYVLRYDEENGTAESVFLNLSDGEVLTIDNRSALIKEVSKASWMPD